MESLKASIVFRNIKLFWRTYFTKEALSINQMYFNYYYEKNKIKMIRLPRWIFIRV